MRSSRSKDKEHEEEEEEDRSRVIPLGTVAYSKWAGRFTWTAIIQGAIVALLTAMLAAFVATTGYSTQLVHTMLSINTPNRF
jgi:hypothetical protein